MIVPRSSQLITQDQEFALFNVTLFKKVVEEFKLHAREKKFVVRDFTYNEEELAAGKNEITKLVTDKKKQFVRILRSLMISTHWFNMILFWFLAGSTRSLVEGELQRNILCMDSRQGTSCIRWIRSEVNFTGIRSS